MTENETESIAGQARVRNNDVRPSPGAKRALSCLRILAALLMVILSVAAWSQTQLATVSGTINDPTGAVVPGVIVTLVNQRTGLKRHCLTDATGEYGFVGLPTGNYSLRVEKAGFQSQIRDGVQLNSAAEVTIDSRLAMGSVQQRTSVVRQTDVHL